MKKAIFGLLLALVSLQGTAHADYKINPDTGKRDYYEKGIATVSTSVTTSNTASMGFDSNAWATGRGAVQVNDGTANTFLVGTLVSDAPSNGEVPTWNTGGTITWEAAGAGAGDLTRIGDCTTGDCFTGTSGSDLTFNSTTDGVLAYSTAAGGFSFSQPINATKIGTSSAADATFATIRAAKIDATKIGTVSAADATFSTIIATRMDATQIGTSSAADATFTSVAIGANVLQSFPVSTLLGGSGSAGGFSLNSPLFAGTTTTGAFQSGSLGSARQALRSNDTGIPTFQKDVIRARWTPYDGNTAVAVGNCANGNFYHAYQTFAVTTVYASNNTASSSGAPTINLRNVTTGNQILSTALTIDANEETSLTAATPAVVGANNLVTAGDRICADVTVAGTGTKGLMVGMDGQ